ERLSFVSNGKSMKPSLAEISFLSAAPPDLLAAMDERAEWVSIPSGWPLLSAGDPPDGVWFLVSGSLAAFRPTDKSGHQLLGYIRPGEPVGEMALIACEPQRSSVFAMRDSELLKLSPDDFEQLMQASPNLMQHMA